MNDQLYADILSQHGFQPIGQFGYRLVLNAWWNTNKRLQVILMTVGGSVLLKADKSYYLKSVTREGQTWARDIGPLHDYLEAHFPELRLSFSYFRDVPARLAKAEVEKRAVVDAPSQSLPTLEELARLQQRFLIQQRQLKSTQALAGLATGGTDSIDSYLRSQAEIKKRELDGLQEEIDRQQERLEMLKHLQKEYERKGSAASYLFSITSNLQVARDPQSFTAALASATQELEDLHRYQVTQKLGAGRLNIQVAEVEEPLLLWIEQWLGGALSPRQLDRLGPEFNLLRQTADRHVVVTPDEDIEVDAEVRHEEKRLAARFVSSVVQRLDTSEGDHQSKFSPDTIPKSAMPLWLGHRLDAEGRVVGRAVIPLALTLHCYLSGTTGSGKSYLTRTIIEEAAKYDLGILILDPRNQSAGLLVGEDRPEILKAYEGFGMKSDGSRGFPFSYFAPAMPWSQALPKALAELASGRSIVSFKGMDDADRCTLFAKVLDAVFEASSSQESDRLRLLIVVDEAQRFTRKRVDESAKPRAGEAERALDRTAREGRKYGQALMLVSQSIKDFTFDAASIRQQINTHAFLRNIDREMEYAADILGDGKQLAHLPTGTALVHNAAWGTLHVQVRPPFSKVFEFNEADTCNIAAPERRAGVGISAEAQKLLDLIRQNTSQQPLNLTTIATLAKITSKRRLLAIIEELESTGAIRTRSLPERGRPRIVDCSEQTYRDNTIPGASLDS